VAQILTAPVPIRFAKGSAADLNAAMDRIFELFPDQYPVLLSEDGTHWTLGRTWPADASWYVDPNIESNAIHVFGCNLQTLAAYCVSEVVAGIPVLFTMFHSRALVAPALARLMTGARPLRTIIHIDDHADSMPVLLSVRPTGLFESTTGVQLDLDSIESVAHAVDEGVVNIGNFLTTYMLGKPAGRYIHVKRDFHSEPTPLVPTARYVHLGGQRLELTGLDRGSPSGSGRWTCEEVPQLPLDVPSDEGAIWLDIDMDEFCNRYDGDSNNSAVPGTELERITTRRRIDDFIARLRGALWLERIGAVSIAASPGFFPSDLWEEMIPMVSRGVAAALGSVRA
jgi:hypothetical protein